MNYTATLSKSWSKYGIYILLAIPFITMILATNLDFQLIVDERLFHRSVIEDYRDSWYKLPFEDYNSTSAPLAYTVWTIYGKIVGFDLWKLRLLTAIVTYLTVWQFHILNKEQKMPFPILSTLSMMFFPYIFFFGFTIYTVSYGLLFSVIALRFYLADEERLDQWILGGLLTVLAIYSRQYYLALPTGIGLARLITKHKTLIPDIRQNIGHYAALGIPVLAVVSLYLLWGGLVPPTFQDGNYVHLVPEKLNFAFILIGFYFMPMLLKPHTIEMVRSRNLILLVVLAFLPFYIAFKPIYDEDNVTDRTTAQGIIVHGLDIVGDNTVSAVAEVGMLALWGLGLVILLGELTDSPWDTKKVKLVSLLAAFLVINCFTPWVMERLYDLMIPCMVLLFHRNFQRRNVLIIWVIFLIFLTIGYSYWQVNLK